jgi:hypothetical protein
MSSGGSAGATAGAGGAGGATAGGAGNLGGAGVAGQAPDADGMWETDTSPTMKFPVEGAPAGHYLETQREPGGKRRLFHFNGTGQPLEAEFLPSGFLLVAQAKQAGEITVVCGITGPSLNVSTNDYTGEQSACAVRRTGGFEAMVDTGKWLTEICIDEPSVAFPKGSISVLSSRGDRLYEAPADGSLPCLRRTFDGTSWSAPQIDACQCLLRVGTPCLNPCFKGTGTRDAKGRCSFPPGAPSTCPSGQLCTGDPSNLCVTP